MANQYKRVTRDGVDYVVVIVPTEATVNIAKLRGNLERFRAEEALARTRVIETEAMLAAVEELAPDLLKEAYAEKPGALKKSLGNSMTAHPADNPNT